MSQHTLVEFLLVGLVILAGVDFLRRLRHEMARVERGIRLVHFFVDHGHIGQHSDGEGGASNLR